MASMHLQAMIVCRLFYEKEKGLLECDDQEFLKTFSLLGTDVEPIENVVRGLEKYACFLYGEKRLDAANDARRKLQIYLCCTLTVPVSGNISSAPAMMQFFGDIR